jgi:hypothetical protein
MTTSDVTTLSVLERRHIIETTQEAIRVICEETEAFCGAQLDDQDALVADLREVLRILGADEVDSDEE